MRNKKSNPWGLYDTYGNVSEWVHDCWHEQYWGAPNDGSAWAFASGGKRIVRGGSWKQAPKLLRSAARDWKYARYQYEFVGFRLARDVDE